MMVSRTGNTTAASTAATPLRSADTFGRFCFPSLVFIKRLPIESSMSFSPPRQTATTHLHKRLDPNLMGTDAGAECFCSSVSPDEEAVSLEKSISNVEYGRV